MTTRLDETGLPSRRRPLWQLALFLGSVAVVGKHACAHKFCSPERSSVHGPSPLAAGDRDQDGLLDSDEEALARRFAPVVVLHEEELNRPASIPWLFARADVFGHASDAILAGSALAARSETRRVPEDAQKGSVDPRDWTTYVHVFPRADGGVNVQYWFFYAYSNGPWFFDHDSDWEHVTVQLDSCRNPVGADLAQHENDHPGSFHTWSSLTKLDEHVVVYSARGTHATYAEHSEGAWFEDMPDCADVRRCRHPLWRTWEGGGLQNLGERAHPLAVDRAFSIGDRWGSSGLIPGTSAPRGPLYHRGFCVDGVRGCLDDVQIQRLSSIQHRAGKRS